MCPRCALSILSIDLFSMFATDMFSGGVIFISCLIFSVVVAVRLCSL